MHAPVGRYRANPFGLHDTSGNVAEWCRDMREDWAAYAPRDGDGPCEGVEAAPTLRGGSYIDDTAAARSSARQGEPPDFATFGLGVRPLRVLER